LQTFIQQQARLSAEQRQQQQQQQEASQAGAAAAAAVRAEGLQLGDSMLAMTLNNSTNSAKQVRHVLQTAQAAMPSSV
jgi:hypothetical protein